MTGAIKETGEGEQSVPPIQAKFRGIKKIVPFCHCIRSRVFMPPPIRRMAEGHKVLPLSDRAFISGS